MIDLYSASTPNGFKVSIALEEMDLKYKLIVADFEKEQLSPEFLAISPNGRIPAIHDKESNLTAFESGTLIHLAEKTGLFLPQTKSRERRLWNGLCSRWQMLDPDGQAGVFSRYFEPKLDDAIARYQNESRRIYGVLDKQLASEEYLAESALSLIWLLILGCLRIAGCLVTILKSDSLDGYS